MKFYFSIILSVVLMSISAQKPNEELELYQNKHKFKKLIRLQDEMHVDISLSKEEKLVITKTIIETDLILDSKASIYNKGRIQYSDLISLNYLKASTFVPEGKKYKEYIVSADLFSTKDKIGGSVFYDDTKEVNFIFPKMVQGAKRHKEYQLELKEPRLLGKFYFQSSIPTEKAVVQVVTDAGVTLGFKTFNIDTFDIVYVKETKKGRTIHTWTANNVNEYKHESATLNASYFIPHIVLYVESYTTSSGKKNLLSSVDDLHNWYYELIKDVNTQDNKTLKPIVDSLVANTKTDLEKVKNVYAWVQSHIKYIAFEDGYGGFVPREAVDICEKRFGDCKDMASIITEMLEIAGVKADLTWIGTRDIPYTYEEVHTPSVDNHMIASYIDTDGKIYFLDATSSYLPFGVVSEFIQGKQAMINIGKGKYKLAYVPITEAANNLMYDSVAVKLEKDIIKGEGLNLLTGYPKVSLNYSYPNKTDLEKRDYIKSALEKGNNKFKVLSVSDQDLENKDKPSKIFYTFEIENYTNHSGDEVYINLNLEKYLKGARFEEDRILPYDAEYKYIYKLVVNFEIPEAYTLTYVPENDSFENESFSFDMKYEKSQNTVKLTSQMNMKALVVEKDQFAEWNKMIKQLNKNYSEVIIIKKIKK